MADSVDIVERLLVFIPYSFIPNINFDFVPSLRASAKSTPWNTSGGSLREKRKDIVVN